MIDIHICTHRPCFWLEKVYIFYIYYILNILLHCFLFINCLWAILVFIIFLKRRVAYNIFIYEKMIGWFIIWLKYMPKLWLIIIAVNYASCGWKFSYYVNFILLLLFFHIEKFTVRISKINSHFFGRKISNQLTHLLLIWFFFLINIKFNFFRNLFWIKILVCKVPTWLKFHSFTLHTLF